jgi:hypothetical protein
VCGRRPQEAWARTLTACRNGAVSETQLVRRKAANAQADATQPQTSVGVVLLATWAAMLTWLGWRSGCVEEEVCGGWGGGWGGAASDHSMGT